MSFINFINFNQDASCLSVGSSKGFRIYYTDPFGKCYDHDEGNINIVEMLFSTSLVALVLSPRRLQIQNTKRQSLITELTYSSAILAVKLNRKRLTVVLEDFIYLYDISNMKLLYILETSPNPDAICFLSPSSENCHLAIPLPHKSISTIPEITPEHLPPRPSTSTYLPPITGSVLLFDTIKLETLTVIEAHRTPISCLSINNDGTLLATASDKGTIIRIFSIPTSSKLFQFRRGTYPSRIFSMSFNLASTLLAVSSASETIHVFKLQAPPPYSPSSDSSFPSSSDANRTTEAERSDRPSYHRSLSEESSPPRTPDSTDPSQSPPTHSQTPFAKHTGSFGSLLRRSSQTIGKTVAGAVGGYLPTAVTEIWEPMRDFAFMKLPKHGSGIAGPAGGSGAGAGQGGGYGGAGGGYGAYGGGSWGMRSVVAMSSQSPHVMVATSEGMFLVYGIDMEKGGEGWLVRQCSLWDSAEDEGGNGAGNGGDGADDL